MILKKPYAFLIKYFRIIHIILALPIIYLILRTGNIVHFFSDYIDTNYYTNVSNIAGTYINYFMYLSVLLILISGIAIYFLMRKKEKSTIFYFLLILFYLILFVVLGITHSILTGMEITSLEASIFICCFYHFSRNWLWYKKIQFWSRYQRTRNYRYWFRRIWI